MNKLFAYFCPVCGQVEINATQRVGPYHRGVGIYRFATHAMVPAGTFDARKPLDEIKAEVLATDWDNGVRDIPHESRELGMGQVVRQPATRQRVRR